MDPGSANGAKFNLINNYRGKHQDWAERQVVAGDPEAPLANPLASLTADDLRKLAQDSEPDGNPASDQD